MFYLENSRGYFEQNQSTLEDVSLSKSQIQAFICVRVYGATRITGMYNWGLGAIGSASDSRSEGWEFESLRPHNFLFIYFVFGEINSPPISNDILICGDNKFVV